MARERATVVLEQQEGEPQTLNLPLPAAKAVVRDALTALGKTIGSITIVASTEGKAAE